MSKDSKETKIPCSKLLKEYNTKHIRSITDMSVNEVYTSISKDGGIVTKKCAACKDLLSSLIAKVVNFKPSSPMTVEEQSKLQTLQTLWLAKLKEQLTAISIPVKPTYLRDTVTQKLRERNSDLTCQNIHLEWYLELHQNSPLDPEKIADAIVEHKDWNWSEVPHLKRNSNYYLSVDDPADQQEEQNGTSPKKRSRNKGKYEPILNAIEFIESFPSTPGIETLDARLKNDIKIADEVLAWREKDADTYDYRQKFQIFLNLLQTLPDTAKQITFADIDEKTMKKMSKGKSVAKQKVKATKKEKAGETDKEVETTEKEEATVPSTQLQEEVTVEQPTPPADEDPGEEPEHFSPEEVEDIHDELYKENYAKLMTFLNDKAKTVTYLSYNLTEEKNIGYIQQFSRRNDFDRVYRTLTDNANRPGVSATSIMQFIRNVVLHNILEWGAPAPR